MGDLRSHTEIEQLVAEEHELWEREAAGVADRDPACFAGLMISTGLTLCSSRTEPMPARPASAATAKQSGERLVCAPAD
jgi:hypothetical protein